MSFGLVAGIVFGVFFLFALLAYFYYRRSRRKEIETCTALYPQNTMSSLRLRDECVTRKAMARRVAYG